MSHYEKLPFDIVSRKAKGVLVAETIRKKTKYPNLINKLFYCSIIELPIKHRVTA